MRPIAVFTPPMDPSRRAIGESRTLRDYRPAAIGGVNERRDCLGGAGYVVPSLAAQAGTPAGRASRVSCSTLTMPAGMFEVVALAAAFDLDRAGSRRAARPPKPPRRTSASFVFAIDAAGVDLAVGGLHEPGGVGIGDLGRRLDDRLRAVRAARAVCRRRDRSGPTLPPSLADAGGTGRSRSRERPFRRLRCDRAAASSSNAGSRSASLPLAHERPRRLEAGDPLAHQRNGRVVDALAPRAAASGRGRDARVGASSTDRSGSPGATSIALAMPNVSCCGRASMSSILSRGVARPSSMRALPPPAATWQTEQLTCR